MSVARRDRERAIVGCLLGTAVGDAVGLACEGLPRKRQARLFPGLDGPRLLPGGRGMVSDDTEHTCLVAQALIESAGDPDAFSLAFARRLRGWLYALPAGVGWATLRAAGRLCLGVSPARSGVWSAGNGPAMRSALLGAWGGADPSRLPMLVRASTRVTHTDPRAEAGALAVAVAASVSCGHVSCGHVSCGHGPGGDLPGVYLRTLEAFLPGEDALMPLARRAAESAQAGETTGAFAASLGAGGGVSGYVLQTVPIALHAWLCSPGDLERAVLAAVRCGGDADTTGAIVGAIVGAGVGPDGIPARWLSALCEYPRSVDWMTRLAAQLAAVQAGGPPRRPLGLPLPPLLARNLLFAAVVLAHGLRRLLPPY